MIFSQQNKIATVLEPSANIAANGGTGHATSAYVSGKNAEHITFVVHLGAKNTGTVQIQLEKAQDASGTGATAVPFRIAHSEGQSTIDTLSDPAYTADNTGFTTNNTDNQLYVVEVETRELGDGYPFAALKLTQVAAGNVAGVVSAIASELRFAGSNSNLPSILS